VSDETFEIRLGGRRWELPHLPFRAIMAIQPALFQIYAEAGGADMSASRIAALEEAQIERLARAVWRALLCVEPGLAYDDLLALPFSVGDLLNAFPAVARAAGLRPRESAATPEASPPEGKFPSTR